ncbi:MAG: T9SS type A sorting domain-containing protein [Bacteroidota bacterium]
MKSIDLSDVLQGKEWWQASTSPDAKWSQGQYLFLKNTYSSFSERAVLTTGNILPPSESQTISVNIDLNIKLSQYRSRLNIYVGSEKADAWKLVSALYSSHKGILTIQLPTTNNHLGQLMFEYIADADVNDQLSIEAISWSKEVITQMAKVFPNPINHQQPTFQYHLPEGGEYELRLIDMEGKVRMKTFKSLDSGIQVEKLPADLPQGIYHFQLLDQRTGRLISRPISVN